MPIRNLSRTPQPESQSERPLIPHTSLDMEAREALEAENRGTLPEQSSQDVLQLQKRMMDSESLPVAVYFLFKQYTHIT